MSLVIDANIAIAWFGPQIRKLADAALDTLSEHGAVVPALWRWEVQDVLRRLSDDGHLTISVEAALAELRQLPITVDSEVRALFSDEYALSRKYGLTVYDSAYLEVAIRRIFHSLRSTRSLRRRQRSPVRSFHDRRRSGKGR